MALQSLNMTDDEEKFLSDDQNDAVDTATFSTECQQCGGSSWFCGCANELSTEDTSLPTSSEFGQPSHDTIHDDQEQTNGDTSLGRDLFGSNFNFESWGMVGYLAATPAAVKAKDNTTPFGRCPHPDCQSAIKVYYTRKEFNGHNRWQHKKVRKCADCGYQCVKNSDFKRHRFQHLSIDEQNKRRVKCEKDGCEKTFTTDYNLERHLLKVHHMSKEQAKPYSKKGKR